MQLDRLYLMISEHPQVLMYICPECLHQNFSEPGADLQGLICRHCFMEVDASQAELEILEEGPVEKEPAPGTMLY